MSKFRSFLEENRIFLYCYFLWICLHVILWVTGAGYGKYGFWPFGREYGFLEFFVYVIVAPAVILIVKDISDNGWANRK